MYRRPMCINNFSITIMTYHFYSALLCILILMSGCGPRVHSTRKSRKADARAERANVPLKGIRQTTREEALTCKNYYKKEGDLTLAAKYLEHLLTLTKDHTERSEIMLELADMYMQVDQRGKASILYNQYKAFYPGSSSIQYVLYQEILANKHETLSSNKDQSTTQETLKLAKHYLEEFPEDVYTNDVKSILRACYLKLLKSEVAAAQFYLGKYIYEPKESVLKSAHTRIEHILKEYIPHLRGAEDLASLKNLIDESSVTSYVKSLQSVVALLYEYVEKYGEPEDTFITKLLSTKRHGKPAKRTRP